MKIHSLQIDNLNSFESTGLLSISPKINVFIGKNNSGKSTILKSIYLLQNNRILSRENIRNGYDKFSVLFGIDAFDDQFVSEALNKLNFNYYKDYLDLYLNTQSTGFPMLQILNGNRIISQGDLISAFNNLSERVKDEPNNFIIPYLTKRFTRELESQVGYEHSKIMNDQHSTLNSKIDGFQDRTNNYNRYVNLCEEILGIVILPYQIGNGKMLSFAIDEDDNQIFIDKMGDGVIHILGLLYYLAKAKNKIFLIEEIENYLHPKAIKILLEFIIEKSENNQFFIATHSNVVTRYLGVIPETKIFNIEMTFNDKLPTSTIKENISSEDRINCLYDLGYELFDFGIWTGWLILEESSAERIIRDFLIPWFCSKLTLKLRTISANGATNVEPRFNSLNNLFLFTHLTEIYINKTWVIVDGDKTGVEVIDKLKNKFCGSTKKWNYENFLNLKNHNFEEYYPDIFKIRVASILEIKDKQQKRNEKEILVKEVIDWIREDEEKAKVEFEKSAAEIITILKEIEKKLST